MNLQLSPELKRFVDQQVKSGRFSSADEVVQAGLARLMLDPEPEALAPDAVQAVRTSLHQMERGEVVDWKEHSKQARTRFRI
jgi:putative addiction module CopG family antidote